MKEEGVEAFAFASSGRRKTGFAEAGDIGILGRLFSEEVHHAICVRYAIMSKSVGKKPSLPQFAKIWPKIFVAII